MLGIVVIVVGVGAPRHRLSPRQYRRSSRQVGRHFEDERPEGRQAGANDGGVDLGHGPQAGGDVVVGWIGRPHGGPEGRDADDGYGADTRGKEKKKSAPDLKPPTRRVGKEKEEGKKKGGGGVTSMT